MTAFDFTPYICVAALLAGVIYAAIDIRRGTGSTLTRPEPTERVRPPRAEHIDLSSALRPIGGLPRWEDTKEQR